MSNSIEIVTRTAGTMILGLTLAMIGMIAAQSF